MSSLPNGEASHVRGTPRPIAHAASHEMKPWETKTCSKHRVALSLPLENARRWPLSVAAQIAHQEPRGASGAKQSRSREAGAKVDLRLPSTALHHGQLAAE